MNGATQPLVRLGLFQAGSTQAIKRGELLSFTAVTNTNFEPLAADASRDSDIAIANEEIKAGDRAGYYEIIVPRPGDVFEFDLATAAATAVGASLFFSSSEAFAASGSNVVGTAVGQEHYPQKQGHLSADGAPDAGVTIRSISVVRCTIKEAASVYSLLQTG